MESGKRLERYRTDVTIIGGGPAGSAAAIWCAQHGLNVMMLERQPFPRERPGETLHPGIEPLLEQLGVAQPVREAGFLRHEGNWVQWSGTRHFVSFGEDKTGSWKGFQAWRADLDSILLDRAQSLGVRVFQPCRAKHLLVEGGRVAGVQTSAGAVRSQFLVDAAGGGHWLARQLGMEVIRYSPRLMAYYGYGEGHCPARDRHPAIVADDRGWTWTAKVRPHLYQWTRLFFSPQLLEKDWMPQEFTGLVPKGRIRRADVTWRAVAKPAGRGYFTVGDAATVLDPASSHGVLKAVMSGIMAGQAIVKILQYGDWEDAIAREYCQWVDGWFGSDLVRLHEFYGTLPTPPKWIERQMVLN